MPPRASKIKTRQAIAAAEKRASGDDASDEHPQDASHNSNNEVEMKNLFKAESMKSKKQISFEAGTATQNTHTSSFPPVNEAWAFQPTASGGASSIGDDVTGGYSSIDHSPSQEQTGSGGSDSDDPLGSALSGSSASSLSSNARRSKEIAARPMMLYMISLIAIPIIFLAVYQGLQVGNALADLAFMSKHEAIVFHMLDLEQTIEDLIVTASGVIGRRVAYGIDGENDVPSWAPEVIRNGTQTVADSMAEGRAQLSRLLMEAATGDGATPIFHDRIIGISQQYAEADMAVQRNNGPLFRSSFLFIMNELTTLIASLQQDPHSALFALDFSDMQLLTRVTVEISNLFAMYREVKFTYNRSFEAINNLTRAELLQSKIIVCDQFAQGVGKVNVLTNYLSVGSGNELIKNDVTSFANNGWQTLLSELEPFIRCDFANQSFRDDVEMANLVNGELSDLKDASMKLFDSIVNNADVKALALGEGMKLLGAVIACAIGVVILIFVQKHERKELLQIIDHADRLATAVRRFVPKNQLRMMGIRTVLQAEAGYSSEVAQGLVFNSMRNFGQISEKMSRTELFDWLQLFVARMTYVVQQQRGYLDSILGDSSFSVFPQAVDAVGAAILMQQETDHMNIDLVAQQSQDLVRASCGVHYAVICAGVFGDENRLSCTLVSSDVNLCPKLSELTKTYGNRIMLSRGIIDQIDTESFEVRSLGKIDTLTDKNLEIYDLYQADPPVLKAFKNATRDDFELAIRLALSDKQEEKTMAKELFDELVAESDELQVVDVAMMRKMDELKFGRHLVRTASAASTTHTERGQSSNAVSPVTAQGSSRETTDLTGAAIDVTRVSLADADGERYEELLRRSTILKEKRRNSMAKRSPSLQALDHGSAFFGVSGLNIANSQSITSGSNNNSGNQAQQKPQQQQPSAAVIAAANANLTSLLISPPSNTHANTNFNSNNNNMNSVSGAVPTVTRTSPARNTNTAGVRGTLPPQENDGDSHPHLVQQHQNQNFLSPGSRQNSGGSESHQPMLRLGSDFAPRVQSFASSAAVEEQSRHYEFRSNNNAAGVRR